MRTYKRDASPHHFNLEIKSYSSLSTALAKKYESNAFEAGEASLLYVLFTAISIAFEADGHKWRLSLYPNQRINGNLYISLYLATPNSNGLLTSAWTSVRGRREVSATFRLFVFDQIRQKYFTVEDDAGTLSRFDSETTEVGFAKFLRGKTFERRSEGYLLNDGCTFGAEVFVHTNKQTIYRESLFLSKPPNHMRTFRFHLEKFSSQSGLRHLFRNPIIVGERKWQLCVYPKGYGQHKDVSLSLYLPSADDLYTLPSVYVEFKLRVVDRAFKKHTTEQTGKHWFLSSNNTFGWLDFMPLQTLHDRSKGFLKNDILSVEVEMLVVSASL